MTRTLSTLLLTLLLATSTAVEAGRLRIETIKSEPFGYEDRRGKGGMMYEIGNLIADTAGLEHDNQIVPYARTVLSLRTGTADMTLRFTNDELRQVAIQVAPVIGMPTGIYSLAQRPYRSLQALDGAVLAVVRSFPIDARVTARKNIIRYTTDNHEHSLKMLLAGRVDAVLSTDYGIRGAALALGHSPAELAPPIPLEKQYFWLHLSRKTATPETVSALNAAVAKLQSSGDIARIQRKYSP